MTKRKELHVRLPFRGDIKSELPVQCLRTATARNFPGTTLRPRLTTSPVISTNLKNKLPVLSPSMLTYSFVCSCSASYVGKTTQQLTKGTTEHKPTWLKIGTRKSVTSAIKVHLAGAGPRVNHEAFKMTYELPGNSSKVIRQFHSLVAKSIPVSLLNSSVRLQRRFVKPLHLP